MMALRKKRLLTVGHSYVVALNRRLAHEIGTSSAGQWEVTAAAPASFPGDLRRIKLEEQDDERCSVEPVRMYFARSPHMMTYSSRLRHVLRQPWDLVHAWEEPFVFAGGQIAYHTPQQVPFVFSTFQNINKKYPLPFSWIERYTVHRASGWIAFGKTVEAALRQSEMYCARPHRIITPGVDIDQFRPDKSSGAAVKQSLGWSDNGPAVIGYMGRFVADKGIDFLLGILDRLNAPWRALFVGGGPLEGRLRIWAAQQSDRVRICTSVEHSDVPAYLNAMDVMCAPSQTTATWREQFGRMLVEAFACGVPVLGSDSGEIPHVIEDAGVVLDESDPDPWIDTIHDLLESPTQREALSAAGRERAVRKFAWRVVALKHLAFFDEILQSNRSSK